MPARAEYKALHPLMINGVFGYGEGDDVHAGVVESQGWVVGEDVEPSGLQLLEQPAKNASRDKWAAYAIDQGVSPTDVDDMGRDELAAFFEESAGESVEQPVKESDGG